MMRPSLINATTEANITSTAFVVSGHPTKAEDILLAFANAHGPEAIRVLVNNIDITHLNLIVRAFDGKSSRSIVTKLITQVQFVQMLVIEYQYNDFSKLASLINSVMMTRNAQERFYFRDALESGDPSDDIVGILAHYVLGGDHENEQAIRHFDKYDTLDLSSTTAYPSYSTEYMDGGWKQFVVEMYYHNPDLWYEVFIRAMKIAQTEKDSHTSPHEQIKLV